jgi:hypothetical protein
VNLKEIEIDQIQEYIQQEKAKNRPVKEIVKELITVRSDVILLSHDLETGKQQIMAALER